MSRHEIHNRPAGRLTPRVYPVDGRRAEQLFFVTVPSGPARDAFSDGLPMVDVNRGSMRQGISIKVDGDGGRVDPEAFGTIVQSLFALLDAIDRHSWPLDAARASWRVSDAKLVNPLTLTAVADDKDATYPLPAGLPIDLIDRLREVGNGQRPAGLASADLRNLRRLGRAATRCRSLVITGRSGDRRAEYTVDRQFVRKVNAVLRRRPEVQVVYGSLDGTLVQMTNDPRREGGTAKLRRRDGEVDVPCKAEPQMAADMAHHLNRTTRVVVYGRITYEDRVPVQIGVEAFDTIPPDDELPTLADLHAVGLAVPGGLSVEDYLDELRGDE